MYREISSETNFEVKRSKYNKIYGKKRKMYRKKRKVRWIVKQVIYFRTKFKCSKIINFWDTGNPIYLRKAGHLELKDNQVLAVSQCCQRCSCSTIQAIGLTQILAGMLANTANNVPRSRSLLTQTNPGTQVSKVDQAIPKSFHTNGFTGLRTEIFMPHFFHFFLVMNE